MKRGDFIRVSHFDPAGVMTSTPGLVVSVHRSDTEEFTKISFLSNSGDLCDFIVFVGDNAVEILREK